MLPGGAAARSHNRCNEGPLGGLFAEPAVAELPGAPEPQLLASFAVLRRAATPVDQPPPVNPLLEELGGELSGYYRGEVRQLLALPGGDRVFLVVGHRRQFRIPPASCLPARLRPRRRKRVEEDAKRASEDVLCPVELAARGRGSGQGCESLADVLAGRRLLLSPFASSPTVELAPDGVAVARVSYRDGTVVSAPVSENAYVFAPPAAFARRIERLLKDAYNGMERRHLSRAERRRYAKHFEHAVALATPARLEWLAPGGQLVRAIAPTAGSSGALVIGG